MAKDRVEFLIQSAEAPSVYFVRYTRLRAHNDDSPIFVFEGIDDPKYYTPRISYRFGSNWVPLSVDGKSNVLELRNAIRHNRDYCNDKTAFFIDSDFDDNDGNGKDDLYKTPCYSIENLYVNEGSIRHLILALAEFSTQTEEEENAVEWILQKYRIYYKKYSTNKSVRRMQFAFLFVRKQIDDQRISLDSLFSINHKFGKHYSITISNKKKADEILRSTELEKFTKFIRKNSIARTFFRANCRYYRGKQQFSFMREFVMTLRSEDSELQKEFRSETGLRLRFKNTGIGADLMGDLSSYAETPTCLTSFLDAFYARINAIKPEQKLAA